MSHLRDAKRPSAAEPSEVSVQGEEGAQPAKPHDSSVANAIPARAIPDLETRIPHLTTRSWLTLLIGIGGLLHLAALRTGFLLDDFIHISMLHGNFPAVRHPLDLYNFVDDSNRSEMLARGILPWWSHPDLTIRFFRPLSSALIWLDHALFGPNALAMHLHSFAWWAAMVGFAFVLYRAFFGERVARFASLVFALAPCHAMPLAWLANRDALISLGLGIPALFVYTRARASGVLRDRLLALVLFSIAFLGGEYTLSFLAYVVTFELVRADDRPMQRIVGVLPFAVPCAVYMGVRGALHYGSIGSGYYSDPFHAPELFLFFAPRRFATLFLDAWLGLDNDTINWSIPWWLVLGACAIAGWIVWKVLRHVLRESPSASRRAALWLGLGSVLAMVPVLAVVPGQRVLGAAMFGIAPMVALVFEGAWFPRVIEARRGAAELTQLTALALGFAHFVHGPVNAALLDAHFHESSLTFARHTREIRERFVDAADTDIVIVRGTGGSFFVPFGIDAEGVLPHRFAVLSWTTHVLVVRTGERGFDMFAPVDAGIFPWGEGNLHLDVAWALSVGDTFHAPGFTVTVTEVQQGHTTGVHFEFDEALAERLWLNETPKSFFVEPLPSIEGEGRTYESDR